MQRSATSGATPGATSADAATSRIAAGGSSETALPPGAAPERDIGRGDGAGAAALRTPATGARTDSRANASPVWVGATKSRVRERAEERAPSSGPDSNAALAAALADPRTNVATDAAAKLGDSGDPDASEALAQVLGADAPEAVKLAAIEAIALLDAPGAALLLAPALADASPAVREKTGWSMWWVEDRSREAHAALLDATRGESEPAVRDTLRAALEGFDVAAAPNASTVNDGSPATTGR